MLTVVVALDATLALPWFIGRSCRSSSIRRRASAARFGVNIWTLRDWENHRREPDGPAQTLLKVIDRDPEAVRLAVAAGR